MRHFRPDPVPPDVLERLLEAAHRAPSVGFMQPWRFVRVTDPDLRRAVHGVVEAERQRTADDLGERRAEFLRLKVEGILECGEVLVVALMDGRERYVFGRRTLPEMDVASAACAIQNVWLTARVEGLGMGWVSIFDPDELARLLAMPEGAKPLAVLCLGYVDEFYERPMLEQEGWDTPARARRAGRREPLARGPGRSPGCRRVAPRPAVARRSSCCRRPRGRRRAGGGVRGDRAPACSPSWTWRGPRCSRRSATAWPSAPTRRAIDRYTGVLYGQLDWASLPRARQAARQPDGAHRVGAVGRVGPGRPDPGLPPEDGRVPAAARPAGDAGGGRG